MLNRKSKGLQAGQSLALLASLLIAAQMGYTLYQGNPFCLNEGCKVVERLTRVSPLVFDLAGFFFFQAVYWGLRASQSELRQLPQFVKTLLLAGLAVEGVLISFQYLVAHTFCAYCLGIFVFILVLNFLLGFRQAVPGLFIFAGVVLAFASLELSPAQQGTSAFTAGTFASRSGTTKGAENFLFYASTCAHCEKVIASLQKNNWATVHFNPIDQVKSLDLPGSSRTSSYLPAANRALLASLGIDEIPVLMTRTAEGVTIRRGEAALLAYFGKASFAEAAAGQSRATAAPASPSLIPGLEPSKDGCSIAADCTDGSSGVSHQPYR
jgi:uncharacterized membrane protein